MSDAAILELYGEFEAEAESGPYQSYRDVLQAVVRAFAERLHFEASAAEIRSLYESVHAWPPFPDTVRALRELQKRYKLVVISNIDDDLFAETRKHLGVEFDGVITAQQARSYKPSLNNFQIALRTLATFSGSLAARRAEHLSRRRSGAVAGDLDSMGQPEVGSSGIGAVRASDALASEKRADLGGSRSCQPRRSHHDTFARLMLSQVVTILMNRKRKNFLLYGHRDQLGLVVNVEFAHQVELVRFHRLNADSRAAATFLHGMALGEQLHHFAFAQSQGTSSQCHPRLTLPPDRVVFQLSGSADSMTARRRCTSRNACNKSGAGVSFSR